MTFLIDQQLPSALARWIEARGHSAKHLRDLDLETLEDVEIWKMAARDHLVVVSKDEDFFHLANRKEDAGRLVWVRAGNCRRAVILDLFEAVWGDLVAALEQGQRIIELQAPA